MRLRSRSQKEKSDYTITKEEAWLQFKNAHPKMVEETLGPQVADVFQKIIKSGILGRFGANANAVNNFETLTELFTKKAFDAGWKARDNESLTEVNPK
jgi:hypothetical protein